MSDEYDGVGGIWWHSEEDFLSAINSPEGKKLRGMFVEDEAKFVSLSASAEFFTQGAIDRATHHALLRAG